MNKIPYLIAILAVLATNDAPLAQDAHDVSLEWRHETNRVDRDLPISSVLGGFTPGSKFVDPLRATVVPTSLPVRPTLTSFSRSVTLRAAVNVSGRLLGDPDLHALYGSRLGSEGAIKAVLDWDLIYP